MPKNVNKIKYWVIDHLWLARKVLAGIALAIATASILGYLSSWVTREPMSSTGDIRMALSTAVCVLCLGLNELLLPIFRGRNAGFKSLRTVLLISGVVAMLAQMK